MKTLSRLCAAITVAAVLSAGCGNSQKAPAEAAVKAAQDAFSPVSADAQKYVPDQAKAIQESLTAAQAALTREDYSAALQQAQGIPARISALGSAIAAKKAELTQAWTDMSGSVPNMVAALKSRADILAKSKNPPAGLTSATVNAAKAGSDEAQKTWSDAMAAAQSGDLATAAAKGSAVKTQVMELMKSINMQIPGGK